MKKRPVTTLFMLSSVDGKISTGDNDSMDVDRDYPKIPGIKEGLHQYYEIEQTQGLWYFNTGRVQEKMGVNVKPLPERCWNINFVISDNSHLSAHGVEYFCKLSKLFVLVTANPDHPAFSVKRDNLKILFYDKIDFRVILEDLYEKFGCDTLTVQSGSTVNAEFLREKLFDLIDIVVAPALIGGDGTSSLIGGKSLKSANELNKIGVLELIEAKTLENSFLRLRYKVVG